MIKDANAAYRYTTAKNPKIRRKALAIIRMEKRNKGTKGEKNESKHTS